MLVVFDLKMSFHAGYKELILFDFWRTKTIPSN